RIRQRKRELHIAQSRRAEPTGGQARRFHAQAELLLHEGEDQASRVIGPEDDLRDQHREHDHNRADQEDAEEPTTHFGSGFGYRVSGFGNESPDTRNPTPDTRSYFSAGGISPIVLGPKPKIHQSSRSVRPTNGPEPATS